MAFSVLIVDDEESVRTALRRTLRRTGYELLFAPGGAAALGLLEQRPVDVVLSDQLMPGMTGLELLRKVKRSRPHAARLMLTGHADLGTAMSAIRDGDIDRFLTKPWDDVELRVALQLQAEKLHAEAQSRRLLDGFAAPGTGPAARGVGKGAPGGGGEG